MWLHKVFILSSSFTSSCNPFKYIWASCLNACLFNVKTQCITWCCLSSFNGIAQSDVVTLHVIKTKSSKKKISSSLLALPCFETWAIALLCMGFEPVSDITEFSALKAWSAAPSSSTKFSEPTSSNCRGNKYGFKKLIASTFNFYCNV